MKTCKSIACLLGFLLAFMFAATAAEAPKLTFKFTRNNVPGALVTTPSGVNDAGVTVGQYEDSSNVYHGYILDGKKLTTVDVPGGTSTSCNNLPAKDPIVVVGDWSNPLGNEEGFLYKAGKFTIISGPKGSTGAAANGINDAGEIVGNYYDSVGNEHGFLLKGKKYKTLDVPGALTTVAAGINDKGNIVLYWEDGAHVIESSLYNGKTYKTINVPGAGQSWATDINNAGDVIYGWEVGPPGPYHGALFHSGEYYELDYPNSVYTFGFGINDRQVVTGFYQVSAGGPYHGFKAAYK